MRSGVAAARRRLRVARGEPAIDFMLLLTYFLTFVDMLI